MHSSYTCIACVLVGDFATAGSCFTLVPNSSTNLIAVPSKALGVRLAGHMHCM